MIKKFAGYAIGYLHVDIAVAQTERGRLYLFVLYRPCLKVRYSYFPLI